MITVELAPDCSKCAALCCVLLAFDKSKFFDHNKNAGEKCHNLDACNKCVIHSDLSARGYAGCIRFDCMGAGQRVTQEVFAGRSWRDDPKLIAPMIEAFQKMREVHDLLQLLGEAQKLPLTPAEIASVNKYYQALSPNDPWSEETLRVFALGSVATDLRAFLSTLRYHFKATKSAL